MATITERLLTLRAWPRIGVDATCRRCAQIKREAASTNYRFGSLIQGIVTRYRFSMSEC